MQLSRRASWFLIAFAAWSWFIWVTLVKNIWHDSRSWSHGATGFFIVHVVLAAISLVLGTAIGWLGWRGLRAHRAADRGDAVRGAAEPAERQSVSQVTR
jgi:hypothetical protein